MLVSLDAALWRLEGKEIAAYGPADPKATYDGVALLAKEEAGRSLAKIYVAEFADLSAATDLTGITVVCPEATASELAAEAIAQAHACHLVLVAEETLPSLANSLFEWFDALRKWDADIDLAIAQGGGYQELLDLSEDVIGNAIAVQGPTYDMLALTKNHSSDDEFFVQLKEHGYLTPEAVSKLEQYGVFGSASQDRTVKVFEPVGELTVEHMNRHIHHTGHRILYLTMWCTNHPASPGLMWLFEYLARKAESLIKRAMASGFDNNREYEHLLTRLLTDPQAIDDLNDLIPFANIPKANTYHLVSIHFEDPDSIGKTYLARTLSAGNLPVRAVAFGSGIVALAGWSGTDKLRAEHYEREISTFLGKVGHQTGVSLDFTDLKNVRAAFDQAEQAIRLGARIRAEQLLKVEFGVPSRMRTKNLYPYQDVWCHDTLLKGMDLTTAHSVFSAFTKLARHDAGGSKGLLSFACVWLECGGNASKAAELLGLHRNTVPYRIKRIEEVTGLVARTIEFQRTMLLGCAALETFGMELLGD